MPAGLAFDFETYHAARRTLVEDGLKTFMSSDDPAELWESMRYSVLSGGKRIRAILCLAAAEAVALSISSATQDSLAASPGRHFSQAQSSVDKSAQAARLALPCACAIEMIHAMSLIHDDLPCMDDDDFRRGKPSNHKQFGEAIALLAGDALLIYAMEVLLKQSDLSIDRNKLISVAMEMARSTGAEGMVGGQVLDMSITGLASDAPLPRAKAAAQPNAPTASQMSSDDSLLLKKIHERKTGALIRFSVWSGACLLGASSQLLRSLSEFGELLGLSFQIADDLLDVTGNIASLGKTPGKDKEAGKLTWVTVYGVDKAKEKLLELEERGVTLLEQSSLSEEGLQPLRALLRYAINRSN